MTPDRAVLASMLFFILGAFIWGYRVPVLSNGRPISLNADEPSHYDVILYMSETWSLPPYTAKYYESAHPPLSDYIEADYVRFWPNPDKAYALRFLSTAIGLIVLLVIYRTAQLVVNAWTAAMTAILMATQPLFIMFSGSVTNDSVMMLIVSLALYLLVKAVKGGLSKRELNVLCLLVGLAGLTKYTVLGLLPISIGVVIYERRRADKSWVVPALSILASFVLISGWWYARNKILFGDVFRSQAEIQMGIFSHGSKPTHPHYWYNVGTILTGSYAGLYRLAPRWPLWLYNSITTLAAMILYAGALIAVVRGWPPVKVVLGAFSASVIAIVLYYQVTHYQPHGRLLAPAFLVGTLGMLELRHAIPAKYRETVAVIAILASATLSIAIVTAKLYAIT